VRDLAHGTDDTQFLNFFATVFQSQASPFHFIRALGLEVVFSTTIDRSV